ncbi:Histidine kinase [Saccharicrinis carchari]|uniref:Histidine kinase n=1 Tax=Saccharicrinis carchari TaxID=1168039 RepID=A0A521EJZ1_SACCC|nr:histidine kinase [Saccharicrinis carchari]SMO84249.1 Histidine kinase [Saccharicrinis carchari]
MKRIKNKKLRISRYVVLGLVSILIGILCVLLLGGEVRMSVKSWAFNIGYSLTLGYGLFANGFIASLIGKRWIHWIKYPKRSIVISFVVTTLYSTFVIFFANWLWFIVLLDYSWSKFLTFGTNILLIEYIVLYIITMFFYAKAFFNEWRETLIAEEALKKEAVSLQYKVLSNQVNPHFLFNSLNVLGSLIRLDADRAGIFVNKLSDFYRNLLAARGKEIVPLNEEVDFVNQYLVLQKERFGDNIVVDIETDKLNHHQVIPMTLQMLVENAIKHNQVNKENKLQIKIYVQDNYLIVKNSVTPYLNPIGGEKLGLKNLSERYQFLTDRPFVIERKQDEFIVKVPLLQLEDNVKRA